jgi:hypothetical protein
MSKPIDISADKPRWAELGLADPDPSGQLPADAQTADVLAFGLTLPGADDPVEGIVDAVRIELYALSQEEAADPKRDVLYMLGRRLDAAMLLLRRADGRAPAPPEYDPDAETQTEPLHDGEGER